MVLNRGGYDETKKHWFYKIEPLIKQVSERQHSYFFMLTNKHVFCTGSQN